MHRLTDGALWGYECLLRGRAEDGAIVPPHQLLDWARSENLTFMLDRLSRETHLLNAGALLADRADLLVLVNFMPSSIYRPDFCLRSTCAAADRAGLASERVMFELVETEEIADRAHTKEILGHYRDAGFGVALDDVGSGFASLDLVADLDPDLIKIDLGLVHRARTSAEDRATCRRIVELGRQRGRLVLAEGIETADDHRLARDLGVDLVQGFLLGVPSPTLPPAGA